MTNQPALLHNVAHVLVYSLAYSPSAPPPLGSSPSTRLLPRLLPLLPRLLPLLAAVQLAGDASSPSWFLGVKDPAPRRTATLSQVRLVRHYHYSSGSLGAVRV